MTLRMAATTESGMLPRLSDAEPPWPRLIRSRTPRLAPVSMVAAIALGGGVVLPYRRYREPGRTLTPGKSAPWPGTRVPVGAERALCRRHPAAAAAAASQD